MDKVPQEQNSFAEYGTHCHSLLERWAKGELMSFELADAYEAEYDEAVKHYFPPFPKGLAGRYYDEGLQYFRSFDGFGDDMEILSVEDKFELDIRDNRFVGIADLVLRDRNSGGITVIDHKSKSMNSMKKAQYENTRQLYTYAAYVKERFGAFPTLLRFNMFRYGVNIDEPFSRDRYAETMDWIERTIAEIKAEKEWKVSSSGYFCRFICSTRLYCPIAGEIMNAK
ncbi:MAG: PD-(D/E)XK nuclease family protein [Clostridia bacterium]|nr:PD-(D/E)XK nuclease family protein [Clostridia bacterium]